MELEYYAFSMKRILINEKTKMPYSMFHSMFTESVHVKH